MKTIDEIKEAITNSIWALLERTECEGLGSFEICMSNGEIDWYSDVNSPSGARVVVSGDVLENQFEGADIRENWTREDVRRWMDCVVKTDALIELQDMTLTLDDCKTFEDVEKVAEHTEWLDMSEEDRHVRMMAVLKCAIALLDWNLDTAVLNCEKLNKLARYDYAEIYAMFEDSEQGGPLPREKADMFNLHVGGLNLCGNKYGTKYNDDGAVVLGWIAEALKLPPAAYQEYQDGWYEDDWKLSEIEK